MENKRYSIVRVDGVCPTRFECRNFEGLINYYVCDDRKDNKKQPNCNKCLYGDTKEQLIKKVAQVLFKRKYKTNERLYGYMSDNFKKRLYTQCLETSKEIVEFLGVE